MVTAAAASAFCRKTSRFDGRENFVLQLYGSSDKCGNPAEQRIAAGAFIIRRQKSCPADLCSAEAG